MSQTWNPCKWGIFKEFLENMYYENSVHRFQKLLHQNKCVFNSIFQGSSLFYLCKLLHLMSMIINLCINSTNYHQDNCGSREELMRNYGKSELRWLSGFMGATSSLTCQNLPNRKHCRWPQLGQGSLWNILPLLGNSDGNWALADSLFSPHQYLVNKAGSGNLPVLMKWCSVCASKIIAASYCLLPCC